MRKPTILLTLFFVGLASPTFAGPCDAPKRDCEATSRGRSTDIRPCERYMECLRREAEKEKGKK